MLAPNQYAAECAPLADHAAVRDGDRSRVPTWTPCREGTTDDLLAYVDGALLVDLWDDLVLPRHVRSAWTPLVERAISSAAS